MKYAPAWLFALALAGLPAPAAGAPVIEVFTDGRLFPIVHAGSATVYDLAEAGRLEAALGQGLPKDPAAAKALALARRAPLEADLRAAYAGRTLALRYGLSKIPAVVFDRGVAVVYGVADVAEAARRYDRWKEAR